MNLLLVLLTYFGFKIIYNYKFSWDNFWEKSNYISFFFSKLAFTTQMLTQVSYKFSFSFQVLMCNSFSCSFRKKCPFFYHQQKPFGSSITIYLQILTSQILVSSPTSIRQLNMEFGWYKVHFRHWFTSCSVALLRLDWKQIFGIPNYVELWCQNDIEVGTSFSQVDILLLCFSK